MANSFSPSAASMVEGLPKKQHQVFISFRGELRNSFISHLETALVNDEINYYIDREETRSQDIGILFDTIDESDIALVVFSKRYSESKLCLNELEKIMKNAEGNKLKVIPVFFDVSIDEVKNIKGHFGLNFYRNHHSETKMLVWKKALQSAAEKRGLILANFRSESDLIVEIVAGLKDVIASIDGGEGTNTLSRNISSLVPSENRYTQTPSGSRRKDKTFGIKQSLINGLKENVNRHNIRSHLRICLLVLFIILHGPRNFSYMSTRLTVEDGAINRIVDNVPKFPEYISAEGTEDPRDTYTQRSSSDARTNADRTFTNSRMDSKVKPPRNQVFINFRGDQLRNNFVGFLVDALRRSEINVFIDNHAQRGEDLNTLFKRIEDSGIAVVVFSSRYTESNWCLEELLKIKERVHQGLLKVLPIYYRVTPTNVKKLKGEFGDHFRDKEYLYASDEAKIKRWKEAITFVSHKFALTLDENRYYKKPPISKTKA